MVRTFSIITCLLILISGSVFGQGASFYFVWTEGASPGWFPLTYDCADPSSPVLCDSIIKVRLMIDSDLSGIAGPVYTTGDLPCPVGHNGIVGEVWPINEWPFECGEFISPVLQYQGAVPAFQPVYLLVGRQTESDFIPAWSSYPVVIGPGAHQFIITCPTGGTFNQPCWTCYMDPGGALLEPIPEPCIDPPGQVQNVHASDDDCEFPSCVFISWDDLEDETGYIVERSACLDTGVVEIVGRDVTSWCDTVISAGEICYYNVKAFNSCGEGPWSVADAGSRPVLPDPPINVEASDSLCDGILITWTDMADNEIGFSVGRSPEGSPQGNPFDTIFYIDEPNTESFFDSTALPDTIYTYVVAAGDTCGYNEGIGDVGIRWGVPAPVTGLSAVGECDRILLSWQPDSGNVDSFLVFRDDIPEAIGVIDGSLTEYADTDLNDALTHTYRIQALNPCGVSALSEPASAALLPLFEFEETIQDTVLCMDEFSINIRCCDTIDSLAIWQSVDGSAFNIYLGQQINPSDPLVLTIPDVGRVLVPSRLMVLAYRSTRVDTALSNEFILDCLMDIDKPYRPLPAAYTLYQNYPNPFNATTTIVYDLPTAGFAKLAVYNVIGREVAVLTNEIRTAGNHEITFDASLLPSGIYFYRLEAGDFTAMNKMVLMK